MLYDPNGNPGRRHLAAGNAADGRNSVITFHGARPRRPARWTIEVTPSPNYAAADPGRIRPAATTGRDRRPVQLRRDVTSPPEWSLPSQPPSTTTVTFNDPVYLPSLTAGELEVNGVSADGFTVVNGNTVTWIIDPSSYANGIDLPNVVTIGADAFGNQIMDVSGQTATPYSYTFYTTNVVPNRSRPVRRSTARSSRRPRRT